MAFRSDFIVKHDYRTESDNDLAKKILVALFSRPLRYNKPVKVGLFGDSGEGKSTSYLTIATVLLESEGLDIREPKILDIINAYTPLEYMEKLDQILTNKEFKAVKMFGVHEARVLVSAKEWQSFTSKSVSNVNAMSRSLKPLAFFIISQSLKDINNDVRRTLNYYIQCDRPIGESTRIRIYRIWHDNRDLENIKLRYSRVKGAIVDPVTGRRTVFVPDYIELRLPHKEVMKEFDKQDTQAKAGLIKQTIEKTIQALKAKFDTENAKVDGAVDFYTKNPDMLSKVGKMSRGKFKINDEVKIMHDFTSEEVKRFGEKLPDELKKKGLI